MRNSILVLTLLISYTYCIAQSGDATYPSSPDLVGTNADSLSRCECANEKPIINRHVVEGYTNKISYRPGESVILYAHTLYSSIDVELIRHGLLDEKIESISNVKAQKQNYTSCSYKYGCNWRPSAHIKLPKKLRSGYYSLKLISKDSIFYVSFIVSPKSFSKNKILVLASTNTWQAYNDWGGASLYRFYNENPCGIKFPAFVNAARPNYASTPVADYGAHLTNAELYIIKWLEEKQYSYDVISDDDLDQFKKIARHYRAVIINTHSEYWTEAMYKHVENYVRRRGNLMYLSGNGIYWKVTKEDNAMECRKYKDKHIQTGENGGRWRELGKPESKLLGVEFTKPGSGTYAPYRVLQPDHWIFASTGVISDQLFGQQSLTGQKNASGASGHETDKISASSPSNIILLAHGTNPSAIDSSDYGVGGADMTYYKTNYGGAVFSVGSISFGGSLLTDSICSRITENVLEKFLHRKR